MPDASVRNCRARLCRRRAGFWVAAALAVTSFMAPTAGATSAEEPSAASAAPAGPIDVWGQAADVPGPNGIFVGGPNNYIYQANVAGEEIDVVDPESGEVLDRIGPERGVHGPDDLYVTPDGTIYWTEIFQGNVGRLAPDGTWRIQHVELGTNPITMNAQGRLFVALDFLGNGLFELDPELIAPPKLLIRDIEALNGFGFGPDGKLYGPLFFQHKVVKIDVDANPPTVETVADGFRVPSAVDFDSKGRMIVTDFAEGQIWRIDLATGTREKLLDIEGIIDNSEVGPDDSVYSAAFGDGQIWKIDPSGASRPLTNSGLFAAGGVAVEPDGSVVVANWFTLNRYTNGELTRTFYDRFDAPGEGMSGPNTVAVDGPNLILTGFFSNFLQVMDAKTGAILKDVRDLKTPTNAIAYKGDIAVSEKGGDVLRLSDRSVLIDGLDLPTGLATDGTTLYVADWKSGGIWAVGPAGKKQVAYGLNHPEGLAVAPDGKLLVAEEGLSQVTSVDLTNGDRRAVAHVAMGRHYAPGLIDYNMLTGIAIDPKGGFWVTSDHDNVVYRFAYPA